MVDHELDALLVGALYGELEPADEARLAAHLESHPTDRTALDDLRSTRKTLLDSRFFELHFDPPAQVSALLVQEAARRAPRAAESGDGWFMRFVRMFALHPAMAAAATLVLVVGVAGTLYMKKGAELAAPRAADTSSVEAPAVATKLSMGSSTAAPGDLAQAEGQQGQAHDNANQGITADLDDKSVVEKSRAVAKNDDKPVAAKPDYRSATKGIVVTEHEPQPKDFDHASASTGAGVAADDLETPAYKTAKASPPAPPPPPTATVATTTPAPTTPAPAANAPAQGPGGFASVGDASGASGGGTAGKKEAADPEDGWARDQHRRVVALVANGRCTDAAPVAAEIQARAPDYYGTYVATDRALKQCKQYIANAVEKQQAQRAKSEAAKAKAAHATDTK
ncbi:MAG TPA: hypothetical protein VGL61_33615 [Kofleriaceae bacterium]|jgi:hypothetical protein